MFLTPGSKATRKRVPTTTGGGSGTPGGVNTDVQFNNAGSFGGDAGFTYAGNGQATLALGTITVNEKALNITGTWNAAGVTFDAPLFMNITNTASTAGSMLADFQVGSASLLQVIPVGTSAGSLPQVRVPAGNSVVNTGPGLAFIGATGTYAQSGLAYNDAGGGNTNFSFWANNIVAFNLSTGGTSQGRFPSNWGLAWSSATNNNSVGDTFLYRDGGIALLALANGAGATAFRVYNTTDQTASSTPPTNYERGAFDWTTNTNMLSIGPQAGGTGSLRDMGLYAATKNIWMINSGNTKIGTISGAVGQQHHADYGGI